MYMCIHVYIHVHVHVCRWLLVPGESGLSLQGEPDPPTFYQTLARQYGGWCGIYMYIHVYTVYTHVYTCTCVHVHVYIIQEYILYIFNTHVVCFK